MIIDFILASPSLFRFHLFSSQVVQSFDYVKHLYKGLPILSYFVCTGQTLFFFLSSAGIISTFLHVHPFGANLEYLWSYIQRLDSKVKMSMQLFTPLQIRCPLFKQITLGHWTVLRTSFPQNLPLLRTIVLYKHDTTL